MRLMSRDFAARKEYAKAMVSEENFLSLLSSLGVPSSLDGHFLYEAYAACLDGAKAMQGPEGSLASLGINDLQLALYLANEHAFYLSTHPEVSQEELVKKDEYLSFLASVSLDKYFTNERLAYKEGSLASRYSPFMSTIELYLNFILGMLSRYERNDPAHTLIVDVMAKGFRVAKCVCGLLEGGYETEAFSCWRTLHENECILHCLVRYGEPIVKRYLRHIEYGVAFRVGLKTKEATDAIFVEIKDNMRSMGLKSKDMKRYIEYGWLFAIPGIAESPEFKLNFRDGVERAASLTQYAKVYEMSSEVTHSSPVLIYSKKNYFFYLTLLSLYESFFRLEKIFTSLYTSTVSEAEKQGYARMRNLYYGELLAAYDSAKKAFAEIAKKGK